MLNLPKKNKTKYNYAEIFKKLMGQAQNLNLGAENFEKMLQMILNVVGADGGSFFLYQPEQDLFVQKTWVGQKPLIVSIKGEFEFIHFLEEIQDVIFKDEFLKDRRYLDIRSAAVHYFTQLSCVAVIPLFVRENWVGLLNLGRGVKKKSYCDADRTLLPLLGQWLAYHLSNCLLLVEVQQKNKKLEEMTELKNQLMANVTHELRTPLNGILGLAELIEEEADGPVNEDQKRHLGMMRSAAESLLEIINNILSLIRVEASKREIEIRKLGLSRMIREAGGLFKSVLSSHENQFQTRVTEDVSVYGDEEQIRTVLVNLIGNAVKFTKQGNIEVGATKSGEMIKVCVKDTGIGIAKEDQLKIFDEFRQANGSMTRLYGGAGLGLAVAKKIVEFHGGRIWVDSVPGRGAEFYFTLPAKPAGIPAIEVG